MMEKFEIEALMNALSQKKVFISTWANHNNNTLAVSFSIRLREENHDVDNTDAFIIVHALTGELLLSNVTDDYYSKVIGNVLLKQYTPAYAHKEVMIDLMEIASEPKDYHDLPKHTVLGNCLHYRDLDEIAYYDKSGEKQTIEI